MGSCSDSGRDGRIADDGSVWNDRPHRRSWRSDAGLIVGRLSALPGQTTLAGTVVLQAGSCVSGGDRTIVGLRDLGEARVDRIGHADAESLPWRAGAAHDGGRRAQLRASVAAREMAIGGLIRSPKRTAPTRLHDAMAGRSRSGRRRARSEGFGRIRRSRVGVRDEPTRPTPGRRPRATLRFRAPEVRSRSDRDPRSGTRRARRS